MRLLCVLHGGAEHPSSRFRALQHPDRLRAHGIEPETLIAKRDEGYGPIALRRRAAKSDAVLIQKKLLSPWKLRLLPPSVPVAFDFDDAIFEVSPAEAARYGSDKAERRAVARRRRLRSVLGRATLVLAGNKFLADHASRLAPKASSPRLELLPTGVDLAPFPEERVRAAAARRVALAGGPRIGWIGSRASLRYLATLADRCAPPARASPGRGWCRSATTSSTCRGCRPRRWPGAPSVKPTTSSASTSG